MTRTITTDEAERLLGLIHTRYITQLRNYTALLLIYECGLRLEEVLALRLSDVRLDSPAHPGWLSLDPKSVPLTPRTEVALRAWLSRRPPCRNEADWLLTTTRGTATHPNTIRRALHRYATEAQVGPVTPKVLRCTLGFCDI